MNPRHKKKLMMYGTSMLIGAAILSIGGVAFAEDSGSSAVRDVIGSDALQGDSYYRRVIAGYLNKPISFIITLSGFLIMTFSFLKFALTMLYLTFPTIFDRIDAHQKMSLQMNWREARPVDMISYVFALIMPNVKDLTDYANGEGDMNVDPLSYLKKKWMTVVGFILIGAMIFDGQSRDFLAKAADIGLFIGNRIVGHDTIGSIKTFLDAGDRYKYFYASDTLGGQNRLRIAEEIDKSLRGMNAERVSTEFFTAVGQFTEGVVNNTVPGLFTAQGKNIDSAKNFKVTAVVQSVQPNLQGAKHAAYVQIVGDELMKNISQAKYLVVTITDIIEEEDKSKIAPGTGYNTGNYPEQGRWNVSGNSIVISMPANHKITKGIGTISNVKFTIFLKDNTKDTSFEGPVLIASDRITIQKSSLKASGNSNADVKSGTIQKISFQLGDRIEITPPKDGDLLQYTSGKTFMYGQ